LKKFITTVITSDPQLYHIYFLLRRYLQWTMLEILRKVPIETCIAEMFV